ncbi:MAG: Crp/Fnr family transcriptional regulator [Anaerolineae bacterium]|nr:Crp/Fnr family transcriptional regulator [Anaerolineae bacterium]
MNPLDPTLSIVSRCSFLKGLTPDECQVVVEQARPCHIRQGEFFFHQGEPATTFYILVEGRAKLTQINPEGHQVIVNYIGPGDGLGIIVVLSNMDYPIAAEAVEECHALAWDKLTTRQLMQRYPQLAINGMELIAQHFASLQERYHQLVTQRVEQRIARTLLHLVRQFGQKTPEGVRINMPLTRQDLAEMTGTNLYNVSRFLSKWEQDGIVKSSRKRITLCKPHGLVVIAEDLEPVIRNR